VRAITLVYIVTLKLTSFQFNSPKQEVLGIDVTYSLQVTILNYSKTVLPTMVCSFSTNYSVKLKTLSL